MKLQQPWGCLKRQPCSRLLNKPDYRSWYCKPSEPIAICPNFLHFILTLVARLDPKYPLPTITSPSYLPNLSFLITQNTTLLPSNPPSFSLNRPYLLFYLLPKTLPPINGTSNTYFGCCDHYFPGARCATKQLMAVAVDDEIEIDKEEVRLDCMEGEEHEVKKTIKPPYYQWMRWVGAAVIIH